MTMPRAFKTFAMGFPQDIDVSPPISFGDMVGAAVTGVDQDEFGSLKIYLDELLSGRYSMEQLREIWDASPSNIYFHQGEELLKVLTCARSLLVEYLSKAEMR